ncbi:Protein CBG25652 [Caenorhabditis briggsae]|nr:Protein CBG25652 [Caenorhabditis briggsae]CAR98616.1 Protein CBG25652 [Caenorhabditis briggsae]
MFKIVVFSSVLLALGAYYGQVQAAVLPVSSTEVAL